MAVRIATLLIVAFIALGPVLPSRGLTTVLRGSGDILPLLVTIVDGSGTVIAVSGGGGELGEGDAIVAVAGRPNAIEYHWLGGLCDRAATIRVERSDGSTTLYRSEVQSGTTCLLAGVGRSVVIEFLEPIDPRSVVDITNVLF
jgi:hypothetical protein